jgi:DtxR family Mn-dependent transcriptional regulator
MIRKHRLWETFLVDRVGMRSDQIHMEAERLEHILTDQIVDEVEQKLGFPTKDPHGSPIPQKSHGFTVLLSSLNEGDRAIVTTEHEEEYTAVQLWQKGLTPNFPFTIIRKEKAQLVLQVEKEEINIDLNLAAQIKVVKLAEPDDL